MDYYALNFAASGRLLFGFGNSEPTFLSAPVAWWTHPGVRYRYGAATGESWEHFYVVFEGHRAQNWAEGGLLPHEPWWCYIEHNEAFRSRFLQLFKFIERDGAYCARGVQELEGALLDLQTQTKPTCYSKLELQIANHIEAIRTDPEKLLPLQALADQIGISHAHLRRVFTKIAGQSPTQFLLEQRLNAAARTLRESDEPIKSLALRLGFSDTSHFNRQFRRRYGNPPAIYRREVRLYKT